MGLLKEVKHSFQYENIYGEKICLHLRHVDDSLVGFLHELEIEGSRTLLGNWFSLLIVSIPVCFFILLNQIIASIFLSTILCVILYNKIVSTVYKESVLIIKSIGIQIQTTSASGRRKTQFVAWERIHDIVINEAITLQRVLFYLAILLQSNNQHDNPVGIVPVFQHSLPRLECIKKMYTYIHPILDKSKLPNYVLEK